MVKLSQSADILVIYGKGKVALASRRTSAASRPPIGYNETRAVAGGVGTMARLKRSPILV